MMRKFLGCCSLFLLVSCLNEDRVDPAMPSTFVRYINGGNPDVPRALEATSDGGYVILANTKAPATVGSTEIIDKIKLVKIDAYGTVVSSRIIPEGRDISINGYTANGIQITESGYIISGEVIQSNGKKRLLILQTNAEGEYQNHFLFDFDLPNTTDEANIDFVGRAATRIAPDRLLVLGSLDGYQDDMILAEINTAGPTPTVPWHWTYPTGASTFINKMFINQSQDVIFGGTVTTNSQTDLRLIRAIQNSQGTAYALPYGEPDLSEEAKGMCKTSNGYAMVGSSSLFGKTDRDIQFTRFSESGALLTNRTYPVYYPGTEDTDKPVDVGLNEEGNAVCTTSDNGFIVLATIASATTTIEGQTLTLGRGERDYYLMKLNAFGDVEWRRSFGSKKDDEGVAVSQTEDGGYLILGKTMLANVSTITLIKTNSLGEIQ